MTIAGQHTRPAQQMGPVSLNLVCSTDLDRDSKRVQQLFFRASGGLQVNLPTQQKGLTTLFPAESLPVQQIELKTD